MSSVDDPEVGTSSTMDDGDQIRRFGRGLLEYDPALRRVWVGGQRLHHGTTGAMLAGAGIAGLAARRLSRRGGLEWALFGSVLMAHDWRDRTRWFKPGRQA